LKGISHIKNVSNISVSQLSFCESGSLHRKITHTHTQFSILPSKDCSSGGHMGKVEGGRRVWSRMRNVASAACISFILSDWEQLKERAAKYAPGQGPWPDGIRILVGHNHNQLLHEKSSFYLDNDQSLVCVVKPGYILSTLPSLKYFVPKRTYTKRFPLS